jgi:hypothetical protein
MCLRDDVCQTGADHSGIQAGEEESHAPTEVGDLVTMRVGNALDQAMQAQPSQVVSHLAWGQLIWGEAQERRQQRPQVVIGEPLRQKSKGNESIEQGLDAWVSEAQGRHPLSRKRLRLVHLLEGVFSEKAIVADLLDVQETSVSLKADVPQSGQVFQPFANVEVARIVDGGFGA